MTDSQRDRLAVQARNPLTTSPEGVPYDQQLPVFVYGTLRPGHGNYSWSLDGKTVNEQTGRMPGGTMWTNGGFPYVAEIDDPDSPGVVGNMIDVEETHWDQVRHDLDRLEGFSPGEGFNHYVRVVRDIELDDGTTQRAWVYLASPEVARKLDDDWPRVPSGDFESDALDHSRRRREQVDSIFDQAPSDDDFFDPDANCLDCDKPGSWLCDACTAQYE